MDSQPSFCPRHPTYASARRFMLAALLDVRDRLPAQARSALLQAVTLGGTGPQEEVKLREGLWESIEGRTTAISMMQGAGDRQAVPASATGSAVTTREENEEMGPGSDYRLHRTIFAVTLACSGCVAMDVAETAGASGYVVSSSSGRPISGAKVCLKERQTLCSITDVTGRFELKPVMRKVKEFFMMEEFPYGQLGQFVVSAEGYRATEVQAKFSSPLTVQLD